jgi:hypothetical protein
MTIEALEEKLKTTAAKLEVSSDTMTDYVHKILDQIEKCAPEEIAEVKAHIAEITAVAKKVEAAGDPDYSTLNK